MLEIMGVIFSNHILSMAWVTVARTRQWTVEFASFRTWTTWEGCKEHNSNQMPSMKCPNLSRIQLSELISFTIYFSLPLKIMSNIPISIMNIITWTAAHASAIVGSMLIEVVVLRTTNPFPSLSRLGGFLVRENSKILILLWSDQTSWQRNFYWTK